MCGWVGVKEKGRVYVGCCLVAVVVVAFVIVCVNGGKVKRLVYVGCCLVVVAVVACVICVRGWAAGRGRDECAWDVAWWLRWWSF